MQSIYLVVQKCADQLAAFCVDLRRPGLETLAGVLAPSLTSSVIPDTSFNCVHLYYL